MKSRYKNGDQKFAKTYEEIGTTIETLITNNLYRPIPPSVLFEYLGDGGWDSLDIRCVIWSALNDGDLVLNDDREIGLPNG